MAASATSVHGERECNGERLRRPRVAVHEHGPARTRRLRTVQAPVRTRGELPPTARSARDSPPPRGHPQQTPPASSCPRAARMRASIASPQTTCSLSPRRARIGSASRTASWAARRRSSIASSVFPWPTSALEIAREVQGPAACAKSTGPYERVDLVGQREESFELRNRLEGRRLLEEPFERDGDAQSKLGFPMLQRPGERGTEVRKLSESRPRRSV